MSNSDWKHIWTTVKEIAQTLPTAWDRDILWKIYHRVLPTQQRLTWWNLTRESGCPACEEETDTMDRVFGNCATWKKTVECLKNEIPRGTWPEDPATPVVQSFIQREIPQEWRHLFCCLMTVYWKSRGEKGPKQIAHLCTLQWKKHKSRSE